MRSLPCSRTHGNAHVIIPSLFPIASCGKSSPLLSITGVALPNLSFVLPKHQRQLAFESDDDDCQRSSCPNVSSDSNSDPIASKRRNSGFTGNPDGDSSSSSSWATMELGSAPPSPDATLGSPGSSMAFSDRIPTSVRKTATTSEGEERCSGGDSDVAFLLGVSSASIFSSPSPVRKTTRSSAMFGSVLGLEKCLGRRQEAGQQHFVAPANVASEGNMLMSGRGSTSSRAILPPSDDFRNNNGTLDFPRVAAVGSGALVPRTVDSADYIDSSSAAKGRMPSSLFHEGLPVADSSCNRFPSTSAASPRYIVNQAGKETDQFSALDELLFEPDEVAATDHDIEGNWGNFDGSTDSTGLAVGGDGSGGGNEGSNSRRGPRRSYGYGGGPLHNPHSADISAVSVYHEQALVGTPMWEQPSEVDEGSTPIWDVLGVGRDRDGWATPASFVL